MYLSELLRGVTYHVDDFDRFFSMLDYDITSITDRLSDIVPGTLFFAVKGENFDSTRFCKEAEICGAAVIVSERELNLSSALNIITPNIRQTIALSARNFYNTARSDMKFIGVTGTNGKTTTAFAIFDILRKFGKNTALIGTVENRINDDFYESEYTTPTAISLHEFLDTAIKRKCEYCVMEASSHALSQDRLYGIRFALGIFTNITMEHTDYHKTMQDYKISKLKLFSLSDRTLANMDSAEGKVFWRYPGVKTFSTKQAMADYYCEKIVFSSKLKAYGNTESTLKTKKEEYKFELAMIGEYNLSNCLAAFAAADILGVPPEISLSALKSFTGVSGRMEQIHNNLGINIIIDYAHTPDAVENLLLTVRRFTEKNMILVFGCGGDRDKTKRPVMGKIACEYADFIIVTSDNPRNENAEAIINDIVSGMSGNSYRTIVNRYRAIRYAIREAKKGDTVIISGKGHEKKQIVSNRIVKLSDKDIILEVLREINDEI